MRIYDFNELKEGMELLEEYEKGSFIKLILGKKINCGGSASGFETYISDGMIKTNSITMYAVNNGEIKIFEISLISNEIWK